jgi:cytochrome P450
VVPSEQLQISDQPQVRRIDGNWPQASRVLVSERRARLMVRCACELLGVDESTVTGDLHLPMSVAEFENELRARFATTHPDLVYRTDSTTERARLDRARLPQLPRVILRQGAPPRI